MTKNTSIQTLDITNPFTVDTYDEYIHPLYIVEYGMEDCIIRNIERIARCITSEFSHATDILDLFFKREFSENTTQILLETLDKLIGDKPYLRVDVINKMTESAMNSYIRSEMILEHYKLFDVVDLALEHIIHVLDLVNIGYKMSESEFRLKLVSYSMIKMDDKERAYAMYDLHMLYTTL